MVKLGGTAKGGGARGAACIAMFWTGIEGCPIGINDT